MNPIWGHVVGVVTVVLMLIFIGIWVWAWRKKHRAVFKQMSRIPLEDKPEGPAIPPRDPSGEQTSTSAEDRQP